MEVHDVTVVNRTGKKIRGEVTYNANTERLTLTIFDREETAYIDVNPNKNVSIPAAWVNKLGGEVEDDATTEATEQT